MITKGSSQNPTYDFENIKALVRFFLLFALTILIGILGSTLFDGVSPSEIGRQWKSSVWLFAFTSDFIMTAIAAIFNPSSLRFMLAPIGAFLFVIIGGSFYVKDIYELPTFKDGLNYVIASMFAIRYPSIVIDKGIKQFNKGEINLIEKIGGPGFVLIEPGNAAMFQTLHGPSSVRVSETHFLAPFETVAQAVYLDDQQGDKDEVKAVTRDGIQVLLRDIHFRYRIRQERRNGRPIRRSLKDPYPFSEDALRNMVFNLQVQSDGLDKWNVAVDRALTGAISDFVASHNIDNLTAPRSGQVNPRLDMKNELFFSGIQNALANLGAELLWVDVGHMEIVEDTVDEVRTSLWAADWVGDAAVARAYGDAKRQAYQELGRAEAQAELILSIADAIATAAPGERTSENIRKILLSRTAQILDTLKSSKK